MIESDEEPERAKPPLPAQWFPSSQLLPEETRKQFARFANLKLDVPFPDFSSSLQGLLDEQFAELRKTFTANLLPRLPTPVIAPGLAPGLLEISEQLRASFARLPVIDPAVLAGLAESLSRFEPSNFADLTIEKQIKLVEISLDHSFGTLEALPAATIEEILETAESGTVVEEVLADSAMVIGEHCGESLAGVGADVDPDGLARLALEAVEALSSKHYAATQALSTVVWDSLLTARWDGKGFATRIKASTKTAISRVHEDETIREFYWKAWLGPSVVAYQRSQLGYEYSRNGTVHHASPQRYGKAHAVQALTIATSLIAYTKI
jgi:hypothetical protein